MKRKEFLEKSLKAGMLPFFINGMRFQAYGSSPMLKAIADASAKNGKVFVLIQLNGGNDGLNTIIPTDQYANLSTARNNVLIQESKVLKLNGFNGTGLHPAMTGLQSMFNDGKVNIVQSVGYPNPNFSHFRATDIWHSSSDSNVFLNSGWAGRYLETIYPGFPTGYPNTSEPDPLAISIGFSVSTTLMGPTANTGMAITDPVSFYQLVTGTVDPAPNTPMGHELTYVRLVLQQTQEYNTTVKAAAESVTNKATYPSNNELADQLKIVANLIAGGLKTSIYTVTLGGFDTHSAQVSASGGNETGAHATLLKKLSDAITAFQSDLEQLGVADRVAGMTYSEFGRRIKSNDSRGTDHGAAAPLIVFGTKVNPTIIGSNPSIPGTVQVDDNLPMQYDFRQVYASILIDWFDTPATSADNDILFKHFDTIPIFKKSTSVKHYQVDNLSLFQNYPNPFNDLTTIEYFSPGGQVELRLYDNQGRLIQVMVNELKPKGKHTYVLNGAQLPPGNYYYQLITSHGQIGRHLIKQ
ncbi:MAG: DUF1501 domain-containing protein [Bacteroidetes bacterium]|nr:DUF1501 domain-containing protein [Bacteroidota bacterium]